MDIRHCLKLICITLLLCDIIVTSSFAQRNAKKTKKTGGTVDGKWRPINRKPPARKPGIKAATPATRVREYISPVLRRYKGEAPLQEPSWIHCINNIEVSGNWATIRNTGYEDGIFGQLQCTWIFYGVPGMRLRVSFETMDLQPAENGNCASQFVDVIDLEVQKSQARFCGSKIPGDYVTLGSELRVDIQADISPLNHKGFMASVRVEPSTVQPGMRDRSLRAQGLVTKAPTLPPRTRIVYRRRTTTSKPNTRRIKNVVPTYNQQRPVGENLYGQNHQPTRIKEEEQPSSGQLPMYVYILIAMGCIFILMLGTAYVFRRSLIKRVKEIRGTKETFENEKKQPRHDHDDDYYHGNQQRFAIPQEMTSYHSSFDGRRRRSVIFEDEYLAAVEREQQARDMNMMSMNPGLRRSQSLTNIYEKNPTLQGFQGWNYPYSEPVYDDDRQSVRSVDSVRSSMRHPDHEHYKKMKLIERSNSLKRNDDDEMTPYNPGHVQHQPPPNNAGYYDDTIDLHRQQGAIMMQQLANGGMSRSMNDISKLDDDNLHKTRAMLMAEIPVEGNLLKRQMSRRQSFHM